MPSKKILLLAILALVYGFLDARVPTSFASSKAELPRMNRIGEAQTFKTLASFSGTNGNYPQYGSLLQGFDGNFYGTTYEGGVSIHCFFREGCGIVFKITPRGKLNTVYNFCALPNCADGANPVAGLVQTADGNLYGTAFDGGATGWGTVFKITAQGKLTTIYTFCAQGPPCPNGSGPLGGLMQATDGNFYGTTQSGGAYFGGTVFKITPQGKLTTLHSFGNGGDGLQPMGVLVQATDGDFYGTTSNGGVGNNCYNYNNNYCGTVFKITPAGKLTTIYAFCRQVNCSDGASPWAGLIQTSDGNFYGTTSEGGMPNEGTVFRMTPAGKLTTLHTFCTEGNCPDGGGPIAPLVQADGGLYSTTSGGGPLGYGTVFKITPEGTLNTLFSFDSTNGCCPYAGLAQSTNGTFYSTTAGGGAANKGTIFSFAMGLCPFVEMEPASGKVGAAVIILGNNLTSASSVRFNGTAASFTVVSSTEIKTTAPSGATTGFVTVTTPNNTLKSNVVFRVAE